MIVIDLSSEDLFAVWLDDENRVVSLHEIEGYRELKFYTRDTFLKFVCELTDLACGGYKIK